MKPLEQLTALAVMAAMFDKDNRNTLSRHTVSGQKPKPVIPKGCELFQFNSRLGPFECVAMNRKSALKKFDKWLDKQTN